MKNIDLINTTLEDPTLLECYKRLGIALDWAQNRGLPYYPEISVSSLKLVEIDFTGKLLALEKSTAKAWRALIQDARRSGVFIKPFSGFRSYLYQEDLIRQRLKQGRDLEEILTNLAAPGSSEHHTGRALDLTSNDCKPLGEEFENTVEFKWLSENAANFNFTLSFPRNNQFGFIYEPWHWCFHP